VPELIKLPEMFGGDKSDGDIKGLIATSKKLLTDSFIQSLGPESTASIKTRLKENSPVDFTPEGKLRFCHGGGDTTVPIQNATAASAKFKALEVDAPVINVGDTLNHGTALVPCFKEALKWFEELK